MKNFLLTIFLFLSQLLLAQEIGVYYLEGTCTAKKDGKTISLARNTILSNGSLINVDDASKIILVNGEKTISINTKGQYTFEDILSKFNSSKKNVSNKYIQYVWNKIREKEESKDDEGDGKMNVSGMVTRGEPSGIKFPKDSSIIISRTLKLTIDKTFAPGFLYIYKKSRSLLFIPTKSENVTLNKEEFKEINGWFGMAVSLNQTAPTNNIIYARWANDSEIETANNKLQELLMELSNYPNTVQDELIEAFLESNNYVSTRVD